MKLKRASNYFIKIFFMMICFAGGILSAQSNQQLIIFHAGSLTVPFEKIIDGFKKENPDVEVLKEIAGSRECARKISELHKPCDIMASADYMVIDQLLIPASADWNIKFATNEMAIVYSEKSRRAKEINENNWFEILKDDDVAFGRADPNLDPCGYRSILTMKLAEKYYNKKNLAEKLLAKNTEYIRPKEVDLLALLEAGEIDYIFLYRSVAEQHGLKYLALPDEVSLKNSGLENYYKQVSVEINGKRPGEKITQYGASMVYGITIPKNSPNPELAKKFMQYFLEKNRGLKILEQEGQPTIVPSVCEHFNKLPAELKKYALDKK